VHDWLYEGRQGYIRELIKMGANATIMDPHRALIIGPTPLYGKEVVSLDIRSGMAMIVAALTAEGRTVISEAQHIDRGYENLEARLRALGADIVRED
jgi:UDP-N-acetylglucosamine 1-carboxyvinyltransferase